MHFPRDKMKMKGLAMVRSDVLPVRWQKREDHIVKSEVYLVFCRIAQYLVGIVVASC